MKIKRYALLCLLGGLVGGIIGYIIGAINWEKLFNYAQFANFKVVLYTTIVASLVNVILTVYLFIVQNASLHYKAKIDANISDDLADTYENKSFTKSLKVRFIYTMQLIVAFIAILIPVIGNASENHIALIMIPFIITIISSIMIGIFYRKFDARHPKLGEKHYTEKAFNIMDEGERYITLVSFYKVHQQNIVLLFIGIMILGIFSITTGMNQSLGLILFIILFIYNSLGYLLKVSNFYKSEQKS
ncbi:DUF3169 family protein [Staphylococcus epidermidis]|uniref:DUF3169 family protein n=1 Tax=Staphylococcus epidermidis TaxID=1282 RepID=UPI001E4F54EF|nr:DUF3169 family protein [Staphylococcus epidermidis]MCD9058398.1 DUF3169 family protein [Staphylococcus epidermidis]